MGSKLPVADLCWCIRNGRCLLAETGQSSPCADGVCLLCGQQAVPAIIALPRRPDVVEAVPGLTAPAMADAREG